LSGCECAKVIAKTAKKSRKILNFIFIFVDFTFCIGNLERIYTYKSWYEAWRGLNCKQSQARICLKLSESFLITNNLELMVQMAAKYSYPDLDIILWLTKELKAENILA